MSNAFHRRYKEITRAIENGYPPKAVAPPAAAPAGETKPASAQIHDVRAEVASAFPQIDAKPALTEQISRLRTAVDALSGQLHLSELTQTVEAWAHNNYKQQNEQRRELVATMDAPLSALLADEPNGLAAWAECKEDFPKHSNADSLRERQTHLYECIAKVRSSLRRYA